MSTIKPWIGLGVFAVVLYLIYMLVPPFFHNYQFQDFIDQTAKENTYAYDKNEDQIRQQVFKEAQEDSIPITLDQIQVSKQSKSCSISVTYTVHVNLPAFPQDFHFVAASKNTSIY